MNNKNAKTAITIPFTHHQLPLFHKFLYCKPKEIRKTDLCLQFFFFRYGIMYSFTHLLSHICIRRRQVSHLLYDNVIFEAPHSVSEAPASRPPRLPSAQIGADTAGPPRAHRPRRRRLPPPRSGPSWAAGLLCRKSSPARH